MSKFSNSKQSSCLRIYRGGKRPQQQPNVVITIVVYNIISIKQELIFMNKQLKCCKQTSALDVATQWACAELLQRVVSQLQNHQYSSVITRETISHA